ncbi:AMP-binding protein [Streptomyces sp. NBC_01352]|uniref:AMP-binding protein n=1 Tax=unclassified Streptomyces TaxID=2593676 RepID=UPI00224C95BB|nr:MULTISPECIES: AMP-binding protein [unclassified Streptomyces]MCX4706565.1 AMP-binding protein [Streptomyces sp. NBC_01373]
MTILEGYGLSETSPPVSFAQLGQERRVGSVGVPIPVVEVKLVNDDWSQVKDDPEGIGEIAVNGHHVMKGCDRRPETPHP